MPPKLEKGIPVLCGVRKKKNTVYRIIVGGHTDYHGKHIEIQPILLKYLIERLNKDPDVIKHGNINTAIENRSISEIKLARAIKSLSSGLDMSINLAKGPGKTTEEAFNNFLKLLLKIWDEINESRTNRSKNVLPEIVLDEPFSKASIPTINMTKVPISPNMPEFSVFQTDSSGIVFYNNKNTERCQACGRPENICVCGQ